MGRKDDAIPQDHAKGRYDWRHDSTGAQHPSRTRGLKYEDHERSDARGSPHSFDPSRTRADITAYYGTIVYDTLFAIDANLKPQPEMVGKGDLSESEASPCPTRLSEAGAGNSPNPLPIACAAGGPALPPKYSLLQVRHSMRGSDARRRCTQQSASWVGAGQKV